MRTMINNISKKITLGTLVVFLGLSSCQDYIEVEPQDKLNIDQVYRDVFDADAAIVGLYGKFIGLAEKYVVLNELRADLLSPTINADLTLQELNEHSVSQKNPYANPKDFYELINNCNDILKNFLLMRADNRMDATDFNQRYSDVGALRSWLYLQLGIHYGSVPYITEPIANINDVKDLTTYPRISFDELLDELIAFTEDLPYKDLYATGSSLLINVDGFSTEKFFINKGCLLGDIQLWKGNYLEAASHYKNVMETGTGSGNDSEVFDTYRVKYAEIASNEDLAVGYLRYREQDATGLVISNTKGWGSIFAREADVLWNTEWVWSIPYSFVFSPKYPFVDLFANDYLIKPSQEAISLWDNEKQNNGIPYDARGQKFSYFMDGENPVVKKYLYNYIDPVTNFYTNTISSNKTGRWMLYRAAKLHLRFAEAANRDGQHRVADALLNFGLQREYTVSGETDVTNIEQTHLPYPYNFDARQGDFPYFRSDWHRNGGIRGRAYVQRAEVVGDSLISIEDNLIKESALELAFEGNRWGDLVRVALRRNDPAFLADKIRDKLIKEGNANAEAVHSRLLNTDNWYLPFTWKEDE
ncbi:RagB/SusD family nutrient uptake outer membrane protein [Thalassobellus citreus]|uniref:RagB/SusD family nutrient uptake outer membrane protein n=1 Tax=Thalassobellus citreus TaxID=3367752 RepID=UPI0037AC1F24